MRAEARIEALAEEAVAMSAPTLMTAAAPPVIGPIEVGNATWAAWATGAPWLSSGQGITPSMIVTNIA
jgi:hypothetical protein